MRAIARAYGDEPLDRVVVGETASVFYIAAQSVADSMEPGELGGVGFPKNYVFQFDQRLFDSLSAAFRAGEYVELAKLWTTATPLKIGATETA